jgi:hypothetical protein
MLVCEHICFRYTTKNKKKEGEGWGKEGRTLRRCGIDVGKWRERERERESEQPGGGGKGY